jgi:hypothetical protein
MTIPVTSCASVAGGVSRVSNDVLILVAFRPPISFKFCCIIVLPFTLPAAGLAGAAETVSTCTEVVGDDSSLLPVEFVILLLHIELIVLLLIAVKFPENRTPKVCCMAYTTANTSLSFFAHTSCTVFSSAMFVFVWMNTRVAMLVVLKGAALFLVVSGVVVVVVTTAKLVVSGVVVITVRLVELAVIDVLDGILVVLGAVCVAE